MKSYFKTFLIVIIICVCIVIQGSAQPQCHKKGLIAGETWTTACSAYIIDSAIFVASLTINPGVIIKFSGNYIFEVGGVLSAIGSVSDSIKFTTDSSIGWQGIKFQNSGPGPSIMKWCSISKANNSGIRILGSFPRISNCNIHNNSSPAGGGGMYISLPSSIDTLQLKSCTIQKNSTSSTAGGGIWVNAKGVVSFSNCSISNNLCQPSLANAYGGGIFIDSGSIKFDLCRIESNVVRVHAANVFYNLAAVGGGVYARDTVTFHNTILNNNTAVGTKGGLGTAVGSGGALFMGSGVVTCLNCILTNNSASGTDGSFGGGISISTGKPLIENCTFADNSPHAIQNNGDSINVINSILYFNNGGGVNPQVNGKVEINFSDVQGGFSAGTGIIDFNPIFQSTGVTGNYTIVTGSSCIDAGNPNYQYNDSCSPPSLGFCRNDMGAHGGLKACGWSGANYLSNPCSDMPLSVTWVYFKAQPRNSDTHLTWATAQEENSKEFIIERSYNAKEYTSVATVKSTGTTSRQSNYQYTDTGSLATFSKIIYYRLKQVDLDGKYSYSSIAKIDARQSLKEIKVFPNPFNKSICLQVSNGILLRQGDYIQLFSTDGKICYQSFLKSSNNSVLEIKNLPKLAQGLYFIKATINKQYFMAKIVHQ